MLNWKLNSFLLTLARSTNKEKVSLRRANTSAILFDLVPIKPFRYDLMFLSIICGYYVRAWNYDGIQLKSII